MSNIGIKETKKLVRELGNIIDGVDEIVEDGINFRDIFRLLKILSDSKDTIEQFKKFEDIQKELKDLQPAEIEEIGQEFLKIVKKVLD